MATCQQCGKSLGCGCQLKKHPMSGLMVCSDCLSGSNSAVTNDTVLPSSPTNDVKPSVGGNSTFKVIISKVTGTITKT